MKCGKGWTNRCPDAKKTRCVCSCGGRNHGSAQQLKLDIPEEVLEETA